MPETLLSSNRLSSTVAPVPPLTPPARLLMGPGPSNPDPRVLAAMSANLVGHLDPYFVDVMDQTMRALRRVFQTENHHTLPISGTGSSGLEAILTNVLQPGENALICVGGYFGLRLAELARRTGANRSAQEVPLGHGEIDWAQYLAVLEEIEYHGWLTIEREGGGNRVADVAAGIDFLGAFVGHPV